MKKVLIDFSGVLLLYLVIFFGVIAISSRISYINSQNEMMAINK